MTLPRRITMIRSEYSNTSRSLCVMKMIDFPLSVKERIILNSSSASCGVNTAVGSSNIRILASRYNNLIISTRCCTPTGKSPTIAFGSTFRLNCLEISMILAAAVFRSRISPKIRDSSPSITLSVTVKTGISMKC